MNHNKRKKTFRKIANRTVKERNRILIATNKDIAKLLRQAQAHIRSILAGVPTDFQAFQFTQLEQNIRNVLAEFELAGNAVLSSAASSATQAGIALVDKPIEAAGIRISAILAEVDTGQLAATRAFLTSRIKDISAQLATKINNDLSLVMIGAKSPGDVIGGLSKIIEGGRSRAISIVRTNIGSAFSSATQRRQEMALEVLPGLKKQWRRSGKIYSRIHHDSIDGQIVPVDQPFTLGNGVQIMFPRDPAAPVAEVVNCGCESLPFLEDFEVKNPERVPFTDQELELDEVKRAIAKLRHKNSLPVL